MDLGRHNTDMDTWVIALVKPIIGVTGLVGGATALAYVVGYFHLLAYYGSAGAIWAVNLHDVPSVMKVKMMNLLLVLAGLLPAILLARNPNVRSGLNPRISPIISIIVTSGFFALFLYAFNVSWAEAVAAFLSMFLLLFAGVHFVFSLFGSASRLFMPYYSFIAALVACTFVSGWLQGKADFNLETSRLPHVVASNGSWRLVSVLDTQAALVVGLADKRSKHIFRVVSLADVQRIGGTRQ